MKEDLRRLKQMIVPTLIMAILAVTLFVIALVAGKGQHIQGLRSAMMMTLQVLPLLLFAFITAGLIQALLPKDLLSRWVGIESGLRGILIGTLGGALTPGGPYVSLPIAAGLLKAGASVPTMVAYLTSWSLWNVARLPMEVGIMGWRFTLIRFASSFIFPPIAGLIAIQIGKWIR